MTEEIHISVSSSLTADKDLEVHDIQRDVYVENDISFLEGRVIEEAYMEKDTLVLRISERS